MNKPWLGYLSSFFLLLAGIFQFMAGKLVLGILFTVVSIAGVVLNIYMRKKQRENDSDQS